MTRQRAVGIEQRLPLRMRWQQRQIFRPRAGENHAVVEVRIDAPPQFTVDKVTQTPGAETKRNQRRNEVRNLEEGTLRAFGENDHHQNHADQAAVEGHTAVPDAEQIERIVEEHRQVVEEDIAKTPAEENPKESGVQQVFNFVFCPTAAWTIGPTGGQPHRKNKPNQVHQAVPVEGDRSNGKNYRIKLRKMQVATIHLSP